MLYNIVRTHQVLMNEFSLKVGMPVSRLVLMRMLANASPKDVGIMEIARTLRINASAVTRQLKEMEAEGIVQRRADEMTVAIEVLIKFRDFIVGWKI